ncbi:unnamed protein product [Rotaria socialis]|uniref:Reverse transcriptase domain-containing protein n=3 Tax=Rotaria socialis TaxID=392032 RepID=A0A817VRU4_9BILA|nr:unnamed protein product [Rotaria socialis]
MNELLAKGRWDYVVVYLDDIVIFSKTIEEHKQHVANVISTLHKANFQVSPAKCSIAVKKIEFLSHIVTSDKVEPSLDKIKAIVNIAPPKTLSQVNKFIGKATNKTRTKRNEFRWGQEQQDAFDKFESILTSAPLFLDFPDRSAPFILSTDASDLRIAGVLKQDTTDGLKICYYKSRLLNDTESRYSTTEREALAIYWCLTELRNYIGDSEITIETDHKPLVNMHKKRNYGNKRIDNWLIYLQDLIPQIIEIKYRRDIDNIGPDYLTRYETIDSDNQQQSLSAITRSITRQATASASSLPTVTEDHPTTSTPLLKSTSILDFTLEKIKIEQDTDTDIQLIISRIHAQKKMNNYVLYNNILFRLITKKNDGTKSKVPYLPASMLNTVL